jgi:competence/damage-inducible protein CinA-like protein
MRAEIVSVGSELLLGQIVDTNAAFIARQLAALGLDLFQKTTVGDNLGRVAAALETALGRADVVITTGGLGPTEDDITREAVARATGRDLEFHAELLDQIEAFFQARGLPLSPSNRRQAYIPRGAIPLPNPVGTAPCFILEEGERTLIVLPGVPREMEYLLRTAALPHVRARYGLQAAIVSRLVRVAGLGESRVGELLADLMAKGANPTVGTMAYPGQVDVRIAAKGLDEAAARALIAPVEAEICARLGDTVFGTDGESLEGAVATRLADQGRTLGLIEVGTGGLVSERLTSVPGMAGRLETLVTSLEGARRRLGVPSESAAELARAVRLWAGTDVGAALVMANAEGEGPNPVYPTRIGVATEERVSEAQHRPGGDLRQVRLRAVVLTLDGLRRALAGPA